MNLNFNTNLANAPPVSPQQRQAALAGLQAMPDYGYGQNFRDNMMRQQSAAMAEYDLAATNANAAYEARRLAAQRESALAGLGQLYDARQQDLDYQNARFNSMLAVPQLLGGLF